MIKGAEALVEGARLAVSAKMIAGKGGAALGELVGGIDRWHAAIREPVESHIETAERILDESGYTAHWQNDKTPEAPGRLENLKELVTRLKGKRYRPLPARRVYIPKDEHSQRPLGLSSLYSVLAVSGLDLDPF